MPAKKRSEFQPGDTLLREVRAGFVRQGTSLYAWANSVGRNESNVRSALLGNWTGPTATQVIQQAVSAAGARAAA